MAVAVEAVVEVVVEVEVGDVVGEGSHLTTRPLLTTPSCPLLALSPQSDKTAKVSSTSEKRAVAPAEEMLMFKWQHRNRRGRGEGWQYLNLISRERDGEL